MKGWLAGCAISLLLVALGGAKHVGQVRARKGVLRHTAAFNFKQAVSQEVIEKILADTRATLPTIKGATNIVVGSHSTKAFSL